MPGNIEKLKAAFKAWDDSKGGNTKVWLELVSDDFVMRSVAPQPAGLHFAGLRNGPEMLESYLNGLLDSWQMKFYRVDALFGDEDQIAMFGTCSWTFKATGKTVTTPIANLWRFRNGKAYECIEIFDTATAMTAVVAA